MRVLCDCVMVKPELRLCKSNTDVEHDIEQSKCALRRICGYVNDLIKKKKKKKGKKKKKKENAPASDSTF